MIGECQAVFIKEYGVIHLKNALSESGQKELWNLTKPVVTDPLPKAALGFSCFCINDKNTYNKKRNPEFDNFGKLLFNISAQSAAKSMEEDEIKNEPAYSHLFDIATGARSILLDEVRGNYYLPNAKLPNHTDGDHPLFTMSLALGDDGEFKIG